MHGLGMAERNRMLRESMNYFSIDRCKSIQGIFRKLNVTLNISAFNQWSLSFEIYSSCFALHFLRLYFSLCLCICIYLNISQYNNTLFFSCFNIFDYIYMPHMTWCWYLVLYMESKWLFMWITGIILLLFLWYVVSLVQTLIVLYIGIIHCILWFLNYHLPPPPLARVLLIYPVTDVGAHKLISFLLHYVSACTVHC